MKQHSEVALAVSCGRLDGPYGAARPLAIHICCMAKYAHSRWLGASCALDGPRKRQHSILTLFEQRDRMPENTLEALDIRCLASGLGEIIAQLHGAVPIGFDHFDDQ